MIRSSSVIASVKRRARWSGESFGSHQGRAVGVGNYIERIVHAPWAHAVWGRYPTGQPAADAALSQLRVRLAEAGLGRRWGQLTPKERLQGAAWIGYCDAAVTAWFEQAATDRSVLVDAMMDGAKRLGVPAAG